MWAVDLTYVRLRQGFMYLLVIIDIFNRYIVDYELTMERLLGAELLEAGRPVMKAGNH